MTDSLMESLTDTPTETPAQAAAIRAGWTITTVILGVVLLTSLIGMLLGGSGAGQIRFLLEAALCWNVYLGRGWARALLVALLLVNAALLLSAGNPFSAVLGVVPLLGAAALCFIPQVNAYFRYASKM